MGAPIPNMFVYPRKILTGDWYKWFAWHPVKLHGKRIWLKTIYRRDITIWVDSSMYFHHEYGTLFDIITE